MKDLNALWEQVAEKKVVDAKYQELQAQRKTVAQRVRQLEKVKQSEQADVDRLERGSLAAFFYQVVGRMDEKLDKEQQEAYAARVRYDAAARELASIDADLARLEARLKGLSGCEQRYQDALMERFREIKETNSPAAQELMESESRVVELKLRRREIREAVQAGNTALKQAGAVLESLDSARGWSTMDLVGGGIWSDLAKYDHLDEAQEQVEQLQVDLRRFKTELADVEINAEIQVTIEGFLRFADFFFDNLFTDWEVRDRIDQSIDQVRDTKRQIQRVLDKLERMEGSIKAQLEDETEKQEQIALHAES